MAARCDPPDRVSRTRCGSRCAPIVGSLLAIWCLPGFSEQAPIRTEGPPARPLENFVTRSGAKLLDGDRDFRFVSWNIPNLHLIEDNFWPTATTPWRWPDEGEMEDALESVRQLGGQVARTYVLGVSRADSDMGDHAFVQGPGQFNEQAFQSLDRLLAIANRKGIRLIIPLVDNWRWWGGIEQYAGFRGLPPEAFWTDRRLIDDFKQTIAFVVRRKNTVTGVPYCGDKAILGWETGNEIDAPNAWTAEIAALIKDLDHHHLVIDGNSLHGISESVVRDDHVDIVTTHHYPGAGRDMVREVAEAADAVAGRKPYVVGEFGFVDTRTMKSLLQTVHAEGIAGALIWSLRFHSRDGGYYWHSEPAVGGTYKAYHWPGFPTGDSYDERNVLTLIRRHAFQIRGLAPPPLPVPEAPDMIPVDSAGALRWRGSTGASAYQVERATSPEGPWQCIGKDISDAASPYRPLFSDCTAKAGVPYFYRVRATNESGTSPPSAVLGPVVSPGGRRVDELQDLSHIHARGGDCRLVTDEPRRAREDIHRLALAAGAHIIYQAPGPLSAWRVRVLVRDPLLRPTFAGSRDGKTFVPCAGEHVSSLPPASDYAYFPSVTYQSKELPPGTVFLRIEAAPVDSASGASTQLELAWVELEWD